MGAACFNINVLSIEIVNMESAKLELIEQGINTLCLFSMQSSSSLYL
jgi:hypothetical protein